MKSYRLVSAFVLIMLLVACNDNREIEPIERTQTAVVKQQWQLDLTQAALSLGPTQTALVIAQNTQSAQVGATQTEQAVVQVIQTFEFASTHTAQAVVQATQTAEVVATQTVQTVVQATQNAQIAATQTREANPYPSNADWMPVERVFDGVTMVQVPIGCFMMGSTAEQVEAAFEQCETNLGEGECNRAWYEDEQPLHEVCFNEPFWIDKFEVTQKQFARLGGTQATASSVSGDNRPVDSITWFEASDFCERRGGRLPTEAEWEYAARGPDGLQYPWGNEFVPVNAVWSANSERAADVGSKLAGASWVGALDMSGNVWEWVADWYGKYPKGRQVEPTGPASGEDRVLRGGSWTLNRTDTFRTSYRLRFDPQNWGNLKGFRCVRVR